MLAGGAGERIGGAKASVQLEGRPLIAWPLAAAEAAALRPFVVAKADSELPPLDHPIVFEPLSPRHPLTGLVAALEHVGGPVVVLACDMPLLEPGLLRRLADHPVDGSVALQDTDGRVHPLAARYGQASLPTLRAALARGESLLAVLGELDATIVAIDELTDVSAFDPLLNVNSPRDLERAATLLQ